jgi:hypothetical protein
MKLPRQPELYSAKQLVKWNVQRERNGEWIPARPIGHNVWKAKYRWMLAWNVLIGKYDALNWQED